VQEQFKAKELSYTLKQRKKDNRYFYRTGAGFFIAK